MREEIVDKWTEALLSGRFVQGRNRLKSRREKTANWRHCCLGALCELALEEGVEMDTRIMLQKTENMSDKIFEVVQYRTYCNIKGSIGYEGAYLPPSVAQWAGINSEEDTETI